MGGSIDGTTVVQTTRAAAPNAPSGPGGAPFAVGVAVQREEAGSTGLQPDRAAAQPEPRSERDLDELAQALFGRIRGRIRTELIHDREARGLTFDNV